MNQTTNATVSKEHSSGNGASHDRNRSTSSSRPVEPVLTEEMLARFEARAASYDRENRFFNSPWCKFGFVTRKC